MDLAQIMGLLLGLTLILVFISRDREALAEWDEQEQLEEALMIDDFESEEEDEE